jgi:hypothetical protein
MLTSTRLGALPDGLRTELYEALLAGDGIVASGVADRIGAVDEALARELAAAIRGYEFDRILGPLEGAFSRTQTGQV